jgi:hypothetical protein
LRNTRRGGVSEDNEHNTYKICSKPTGCKKNGDTDCKCFVLEIHIKVKDDGSEEITEEIAYPADRTPSLDDMLSVETMKDKYPAKTAKDHDKDYWKIACQCLEVDKDGKPVKA